MVRTFVLALAGFALGLVGYIAMLVADHSLMESFFLPIVIVGVPAAIGWFIGEHLDYLAEEKAKKKHRDELTAKWNEKIR